MINSRVQIPFFAKPPQNFAEVRFRFGKAGAALCGDCLFQHLRAGLEQKNEQLVINCVSEPVIVRLD